MKQETKQYLFYHILDGFKSSFEGLVSIYKEKYISKDEYITELENNCHRLINRIEELKIKERIICMLFACLFTTIQVTGNGDNMYKKGRRSRRNELEILIDEPTNY